ncbi:MAG: DMT family transporter [Desulfomonilaceae bacterium]|nr:DMT family transporter [Desulfomonilaceae bacterium]
MGLWHKYGWIAYGAVFLGVCGHASSEFVAVASGVKGPELSVWRFVLGGSGLVALALVLPASRDLITPLRTDGLSLVWLSVLGVTLAYLLFHWSLDFATVPQVAIMVTTIPIFVGLANLWINKQPFTAPRIITGTAAVTGVALLITDGYLAELAGSGRSLVGVFMAMGCAALVASYAVLVRPIVVKHGALRVTALSTFIGGIGLWILVGLTWGVWVNPATVFQRPWNQSVCLLTIAFFNTTLTQFLWIGGLAAAPDITRASYLFFLKPVIASFLAVAFLGQMLTYWQILAIIVICSSVLLEAVLPKPAGK